MIAIENYGVPGMMTVLHLSKDGMVLDAVLGNDVRDVYGLLTRFTQYLLDMYHGPTATLLSAHTSFGGLGQDDRALSWRLNYRDFWYEGGDGISRPVDFGPRWAGYRRGKRQEQDAAGRLA